MGLFQSAIIIILTTTIFFSATAQSGLTSLGARASGMGNASVALKDYFSPFNNIGASSEIKEITAISAFEQKFNFTPFQHFGIAAIYPTAFGVFSFTAQKFGADLYNEQHYGLGFSNRLGIVSLGIKANYTQFTILETGTKGILNFEFGGIASLSPKLLFGAHIYNLTQARISKENALYIPIILKTGFSYTPISNLIMSLEANKDLDQDLRIKGGMEYQFLNKFHLRSGISSSPFEQHYGLGFSPTSFSFDYALKSHTTLGISHHMSIAYKFYRK